MNQTRSMRRAVLLGCAALLAACGGSGGGGSGDDPAPKTTIAGTVYAAPVAGAGVTVRDADGNAVAGPVTTAADGSYAVEIPDSALTGDLRFEANGGTFTDEATGTAGVAAGALAAYVPGGELAAGAAVHLTPASTVAHGLVVAHGKTLAQANTLCQQAFGFAPDPSVAPANAPLSPAVAPSSALAGLRAAAFSRLTQDVCPAHPERQFALLTALAEDLQDGALDGKADGSAAVPVVAGTNLPTDVLYRYARALNDVLDDARNLTGMTPTTALTPTYQVEYVEGARPAVQGRTEFMVRITRRSDGAPATGLALALKPLMHMTTKNHATPLDLPIVDHGDGTYSCALYYLMNSGPTMGYWELNVVIGGDPSETATFYPEVGMPMGDTARFLLKGQEDVEVSSMVPPKRRYFLFNDGLTGAAGGHTLHLFLAAYDSMMSWPAVEEGTVLHPPAPATAWTVTDVRVEASTDGTTWVPGTSEGAHWSLPGLVGLASGAAGHVYVRLTVNGEQKTTDGNAPSGANAYADFTVTPGM